MNVVNNVTGLVVILSFALLSCNNDTDVDKAFFEGSKRSVKKEDICKIKLSDRQIKDVGSKRFVVLNPEQSNLLDNKIQQFHVGGPRKTAPGDHFYAKWIRPDTLLVNRYIIDKLDQSMASSAGFAKTYNGREIIVNIDLDGKMYHNSTAVRKADILSKIKRAQKIAGKKEVFVRVSYAPFDNEKIKIDAYTAVKAIKEYCEKNSVVFQDDY